MNLKKAVLLGLLIASPLAFAKPSKQMQMPPTVVNTSVVQQKDWQQTIQTTGSLAAFEGIQIAPEIEGRVIAILFHSGQMVKKGDVLVQLDDDVLKAQLKKAQAQLELNQSNYERFSKMYEKGFFDKADLDKEKAALDSSRADVEELKAELDKTRVCAPFNGKIGLKQISVGQNLSETTPIAELQSIDPLYVEFSVPEIYYTQLKIGGAVQIQVQALANQTYTGKIYAIDAAVDPKTRTIEMRAKIPNPNYQLIPGMFAEVQILVGRAAPSLMIPESALAYEADGNYVYRLINHKAAKTRVELGKRLPGGHIIITKGLKTGEIVLTGGQMKLHDGADVVTAEEAAQMGKK